VIVASGPYFDMGIVLGYLCCHIVLAVYFCSSGPFCSLALVIEICPLVLVIVVCKAALVTAVLDWVLVNMVFDNYCFYFDILGSRIVDCFACNCLSFGM
jgi:hypothetical protein